ncbi:MAG: TIM barrel protein [Planctomycetota bacterium]
MALSRRTFLKTSSTAVAASAALPLLGHAQEPKARPKTKLALNLEMWLGEIPFTERLARAADLGFQYFEFWPWRGKDLNALERAMRETKMSATQFTAWGFVPGMNDVKNHAAVLKEIEASCQVAQRLGVPMMTVVGGNDQPGMSAKQMFANITEALKRAAPIAARYGVMLILEPMNVRVDHKGHCLHGSADGLRICREVNSPWVKLNWDLYHMQISEGDLCGHLREGYDQIGYIQLADHPGRREPGTGEIAYGRVMKELWELGYRKPVGVECYPSEDAEKSAARLRANIVF